VLLQRRCVRHTGYRYSEVVIYTKKGLKRMRKELCMHVKNSQEKNAATRETSDKRRGTDRRKKERKEMISLLTPGYGKYVSQSGWMVRKKTVR
jgi:hypothetical protein